MHLGLPFQPLTKDYIQGDHQHLLFINPRKINTPVSGNRQLFGQFAFSDTIYNHEEHRLAPSRFSTGALNRQVVHPRPSVCLSLSPPPPIEAVTMWGWGFQKYFFWVPLWLSAALDTTFCLLPQLAIALRTSNDYVFYVFCPRFLFWFHIRQQNSQLRSTYFEYRRVHWQSPGFQCWKSSWDPEELLSAKADNSHVLLLPSMCMRSKSTCVESVRLHNTLRHSLAHNTQIPRGLWPATSLMFFKWQAIPKHRQGINFVLHFTICLFPSRDSILLCRERQLACVCFPWLFLPPLAL